VEKHLLLTVSDDTSCLYGARFVSNFFTMKSSLHLTLFYVAPPSSNPDAGRLPGTAPWGPKVSRSTLNQAEQALSGARDILCARGFSEEQVRTKLTVRSLGTVKDIIREAQKGCYDAVILGRRGYALFENLLSSSVSRQILDHPIDFPVWICRQINPDRRHVLLCTDGSEPSLRMADHVGYMLNEDPDHRIILLHVAPHRAAVESQVLETAEKMLLEHQLPPERIEKRLAVARNVSEAILAEAKTANCAVVAVGRGGTGGKGWLSGSCSSRLLKELDEGALWVSR